MGAAILSGIHTTLVDNYTSLLVSYRSIRQIQPFELSLHTSERNLVFLMLQFADSGRLKASSVMTSYTIIHLLQSIFAIVKIFCSLI